ncbi:MAG: hypothetical protein JO368_09100, partial [Acidimicrobiales bacterium]|nr:hypothetical protein [Acidimicrobiales bacterium]
TVVLPIDDQRLASLADRVEASGKQVWRVSALDRSADVRVEAGADHPDGSAGTGPSTGTLTVFLRGEPVAKDVPVPLGVQPTNVAAAFAVALVLGIDPGPAGERLAGLHTADHRLSVARAPSGVLVVDDTYNANPTGASAALAALGTAVAAAQDSDGGGGGRGGGGPAETDRPRLAVVTPGMVELGRRQFDENARFAESVAGQATDLVIVGRTNRRALRAGALRGGMDPSRVRTVRHRDEAVAWVRQHLGAGDGALYENDLPDHYP